jgi:hypothetical protein
LKNNININVIKNNFKKNNDEIKASNKENYNNQKLMGQLSFTSVNSSEYDKEVGVNSFLSDSSEDNN